MKKSHRLSFILFTVFFFSSYPAQAGYWKLSGKGEIPPGRRNEGSNNIINAFDVNHIDMSGTNPMNGKTSHVIYTWDTPPHIIRPNEVVPVSVRYIFTGPQVGGCDVMWGNEPTLLNFRLNDDNPPEGKIINTQIKSPDQKPHPGVPDVYINYACGISGGLNGSVRFLYKWVNEDETSSTSQPSRPVPGAPITSSTSGVSVTSSTPGGLISKWSFDGDAKDSSVNGKNGIIKGATFVDGKFGKALSFDGVDDSVSIGANIIKKDNTPFSIVSWFKIPSRGGNGNYDTIYSTGNCDGSYGFHSYAGGDRRLYFDKECIVGLISGNTQYSLDVWHQGVVVYNGNSARIYLDGVPDSNWVPVASQGGAEASDYIGSIASSYYFKGLIDEVRIYNRVLSEAEIQADMNGGRRQQNLLQR